MKHGFTLIELLAVIILLAILLIIAVPQILNAIVNSKRSAFQSDAKLVLDAIGNQKLIDEKFDVTRIDEDTVSSILGLSNDNYSDINVLINSQSKTYISIIGKNKWRGLTACGTFDNMLVTDGNECNLTITLASVISPNLTSKNDSNYYVGENPNNWIEFGQVSDSDPTPLMWRIIKSDNNGIKIVYEGVKNGTGIQTDNGRITSSGSFVVAWDTSGMNGSNKWERPATLKPLLQTWYNGLYINNKTNFVDPIKWCIGGVYSSSGNTINVYKTSECTDQSLAGGIFQGLTTSTSPIGLILPSDYISTSGSSSCNASGQTICGTGGNFLYKPEYAYWTFIGYGNSAWGIWYITSSGDLSNLSASNNTTVSVRPVINLKSTVLYNTGSGSLTNPYKIK